MCICALPACCCDDAAAPLVLPEALEVAIVVVEADRDAGDDGRAPSPTGRDLALPPNADNDVDAAPAEGDEEDVPPTPGLPAAAVLAPPPPPPVMK